MNSLFNETSILLLTSILIIYVFLLRTAFLQMLTLSHDESGHTLISRVLYSMQIMQKARGQQLLNL